MGVAVRARVLASLLGSEVFEGALLQLDTLAPRPREPVLGPQLVQQGAPDAALRVRLEADLATRVETDHGRHQAHVGRRHEVAAVHHARQARGEPLHDPADEGLIGLDQRVTPFVGRRLSIRQPKLVELGLRSPLRATAR